MKNINNIKKSIASIIFFIFLPYLSLCSDISSYQFKIYFDTLGRELNIDLVISISKTENIENFLLSDDANINEITINNKQIKFNHKNDTLSFIDTPNEKQLMHITYKLPVDSFKTKSNVIILRRENRWYPIIYNKIFKCELLINDLSNYYIIASGDKIEGTGSLDFKTNYIQTIPLIILSKSNFNKVQKKDNVKFNFYEIKNDTINKAKFYKIFEESFNFYTNIFKNKPFSGEFEIIEIPDMDFYLCQSLRNIIIYGKPFLSMYLNDNYNWISHEVAHQWWGLNLFFNSEKENYWFLSEAMTEYLKVEFVKKEQGKDETNKLFKKYLSSLEKYITKDNDIAISDIKNVFSQNTGILMYNKGPLINYCLSEKVGEDAFLKILADLYNKYIYSSIDYQTFLSALRKNVDDKSLLYLNDMLKTKGLEKIKEDLNKQKD